jgi:hypothetical protein
MRLGGRYTINMGVHALLARDRLVSTQMLCFQRDITDGRRVAAFYAALMTRLSFRAPTLVGGVTSTSMVGH